MKHQEFLLGDSLDFDPGGIKPTQDQIELNIGKLRTLGKTSSLSGVNLWWPSVIMLNARFMAAIYVIFGFLWQTT